MVEGEFLKTTHKKALTSHLFQSFAKPLQKEQKFLKITDICHNIKPDVCAAANSYDDEAVGRFYPEPSSKPKFLHSKKKTPVLRL